MRCADSYSSRSRLTPRNMSSPSASESIDSRSSHICAMRCAPIWRHKPSSLCACRLTEAVSPSEADDPNSPSHAGICFRNWLASSVNRSESPVPPIARSSSTMPLSNIGDELRSVNRRSDEMILSGPSSSSRSNRLRAARVTVRQTRANRRSFGVVKIARFYGREC